MVYFFNPGCYGFNVNDAGKEYFVSKIVLKAAHKNISEFWVNLTPEDKEVFLAEKNPKTAAKKINDILNQDLFTIADLDKAYKDATEPGENSQPKSAFSSYMEVLTKALPKQEKLPFASLQEMYDTAKPAKGKKGAAKTLGKTSPGLTFSQYQPLNLEIKNTTSPQDFKVDSTNIQGQIFVTNWAESQPKQPKKDK